ncbi:MAG: hypothetical protein ACLU9S_10090 [Oscillospiraceae bacterium]
MSLLDLSGPALDRYGSWTPFSGGRMRDAMPFRPYQSSFHLIDSPTKTVYIPLDGGVPLTDRLRAGERSQALFRRLGQYGVSLYDQHYQALRSRPETWRSWRTARQCWPTCPSTAGRPASP